ncbi:MAG: alpha/beta hydrolase [Pseudomonadota bacterium]
MPDYTKLIDKETWAFIDETASYYPPDTYQMSLADQRAIYDRMCRAFFQGYPDSVTARDSTLAGVPVRTYSGADAQAQIVYFHGGGFVVGGLESHDDVCAELCEGTGCTVTAVDYRLAPEHKHPAMFDDAIAATRAVLAATEGPVLLCGDSAGGNLAAAAAHGLRGENRITGQVLIYPGLGGDINAGSYLEHAEAPLLTRDEILYYGDIRSDGPAPEANATYAPLHDNDFSGLPPTMVITAECDPLSDDGRDYRDAILAAGGKAVWINETGLVHGYLRARTTVKRARQSFDRIIAALNALKIGDWPYA